jgi:hypothetical protein
MQSAQAIKFHVTAMHTAHIAGVVLRLKCMRYLVPATNMKHAGWYRAQEALRPLRRSAEHSLSPHHTDATDKAGLSRENRKSQGIQTSTCTHATVAHN